MFWGRTNYPYRHKDSSIMYQNNLIKKLILFVFFDVFKENFSK